MGERIYKASELKFPCTIEYTRHRDNRGSLTSRKTVIEVKGRNLLTECGDWLWWPTINYYNDVCVVEDPALTQT